MRALILCGLMFAAGCGGSSLLGEPSQRPAPGAPGAGGPSLLVGDPSHFRLGGGGSGDDLELHLDE